MTALGVFTYDATDVRVVQVDGEPWFVAADVARILGYRMASDMTRRLDPEDRGTRSVRTPSGDQDMTVISEAGLYAAVLGSQVEGARAFKRWITHDVLPAIRRTGGYATPTVDVTTITRSDLARMILEAEDARERAEARVAELEPKAAMTEALLTTSGDYSVRDAAQVLCRDHGIATGQRRLFGTLRSLGWIDRNGNPYQRLIDSGRLTVRVQTYDHPYTGEPTLGKPQVRITPKGLADLHRALTPTAELVTVDAGYAQPTALGAAILALLAILVGFTTAPGQALAFVVLVAVGRLLFLVGRGVYDADRAREWDVEIHPAPSRVDAARAIDGWYR